MMNRRSELFNFRSVLFCGLLLSCFSIILSFCPFSCASCFVYFRVFIKPFQERSNTVTAALVIHDTFLVTFREELDSRVALHNKTGDLIGCAIHLGNDEAVNGLRLLTELSPDGLKLFAMAAPRCVNLHQNILGIVHDDVIPRMGDHCGHSIDCGGLRDWLRLDMRRQNAGLEFSDELADIKSGQFI